MARLVTHDEQHKHTSSLKGCKVPLFRKSLFDEPEDSHLGPMIQLRELLQKLIGPTKTWRRQESESRLLGRNWDNMVLKVSLMLCIVIAMLSKVSDATKFLTAHAAVMALVMTRMKVVRMEALPIGPVYSFHGLGGLLVHPLPIYLMLLL